MMVMMDDPDNEMVENVPLSLVPSKYMLAVLPVVVGFVVL